jgi:hypothetical protein
MPTDLLVALPFIFLTNEFHVLSSDTLENEQPPSNLLRTKYYFKPHVDAIKMELYKVKSMGAGTAGEWLNGLDGTGKEKRRDAARWERWDASGGVKRMQVNEPIEVQDLFQIFQNSLSRAAQPRAIAKQYLDTAPKVPVGTNSYAPHPPGTLPPQMTHVINAPFRKSQILYHCFVDH